MTVRHYVRLQRSWREFGQRAEAEQTQERGGRYQERRPPSPAETRIVNHKTASNKCLDDAAAVGRADVADVGTSDWLAVVGRASGGSGRPPAWIPLYPR